mmetsp:Transcript_13668/g.36812  ORF Transcript_13668/g.36812 Transcript_13668/m.36812 type:complete len:347 (-) Transcript_13668:76-1116(-)
MPKCRFLFACDLGDPISCIYLDGVGCMAGTMLGKVWLYTFRQGVVSVLAAYSDEGVRGLYMDDGCGFATLSESTRGWQCDGPQAQISSVCFRSLDKKNTQSVKHVLQRGPWACVLFPLSSTVVHVSRQEHYHCAMKFFDFGLSTEVAPCDFDGTTIVVVDRTQSPSSPIFRIIHMQRNEQIEVDSLPKRNAATLIKIWGLDCLAYAVGKEVLIYDFRQRRPRHALRGHGAEVVAIDASGTELIATLSVDAVVKLWSGTSGECRETVYIPEANYFLGYPYFLSFHGRRILASADEGVFLVELDSPALEEEEQAAAVAALNVVSNATNAVAPAFFQEPAIYGHGHESA